MLKYVPQRRPSLIFLKTPKRTIRTGTPLLHFYISWFKYRDCFVEVIYSYRLVISLFLFFFGLQTYIYVYSHLIFLLLEQAMCMYLSQDSMVLFSSRTILFSYDYNKISEGHLTKSVLMTRKPLEEHIWVLTVF